MTIVCPLSGSKEVTLIEKIKTSDLIKMYNNMLKSDISFEFEDVKEIGFYHCLDSDLRFFYPMITGSEKFYEKLQRFDWYYMEDKAEYDFATKFIRQGDDVLEIGAGKGAFAKKINSKSYLGLELSKQAKTIAEKNGVQIVNELIQEHAVENREKYSVVCAFQVLEHIDDINSFIESSVACLKPGGLLIYSVPSADSFLYFVENGILNMPPHHISWWTDKALKKVADIFGLEIVDIEHERLADIHLRWYTSTVSLKALKSIFGLKSKLIDNSFSYKFLSKTAAIMGRIYEKGLKNSFIRPNGHSVTVVYRKMGEIL